MMLQFSFTVALLCGSLGLMLFVIGSIFSAIVALGNEQRVYGWLIFLVMPVSLIYCALNWDKASYSGKMVFAGAFLLLITFLLVKVTIPL